MRDLNAADVVRLQMETVRRWHDEAIDNPYVGFAAIVCQQHQQNFRLWHQEDIARSPTANDREVAQVKRTIDRLNQARNDAIEQLDDAVTELLTEQKVDCDADAPLNSETVGSIIDRLSIMALRLYHYREQIGRSDADETHIAKVQQRAALSEQQHDDLTQALQELLDDLVSGRKRHKTYRHMKMYNDPSLNPAIYGAKEGD